MDPQSPTQSMTIIKNKKINYKGVFIILLILLSIVVSSYLIHNQQTKQALELSTINLNVNKWDVHIRF